MTAVSESRPGRANAPLDPDQWAMLSELVAIAPTNLEDPAHARYEKPNYPRAANAIVRWAERFGLTARIFDPVAIEPDDPELRGIPRPSVIVDLHPERTERVLILAHFDVVPVPAEQRLHWRSPPHTLTERSDGRWYGRGSNDDLGSGVVASLLAMKRLALGRSLSPRGIRLIACCDEETGGLGGVEAIRAHDARTAPGDPARILAGDVALIPDGSPHATAGSSGLIFLDAELAEGATVREVVTLGRRLTELHGLAKEWRSAYLSPDWPDHQAPEPVITGRSTLTRFDIEPLAGPRAAPSVHAVHAENDAPNQIAERVTLAVQAEPSAFAALSDRWAGIVRPPFTSVSPAPATALSIPPSVLSLQVVGRGSHGGYPHRALNPVPESLDVLERAMSIGLLTDGRVGRTTFTVDLRLPPELGLEEGRSKALDRIGAAVRSDGLSASITAPLTRARSGYAIAPDHPMVVRLEKLTRELLGEAGVFGEYGGTDASSLNGLIDPTGAPLPALVFGSMDRSAHIHEAEESVDPLQLARVSETIERFVSDP